MCVFFRYGCVKPKYLRSKSDTDFLSALKNDAVWMITKCESTATDDEKELCENPASSDMIDSLVPVNYFGKIYRNIFCANCNGISNDPYLTNWRLEIRCEETFYVFPPPEKLLQTIKEERCNIFFRPPVTVFVGDACNEQVYTISECNVTGLWAEYNETVDKACNSYVDVFNMTYKNYFCMLCNTNDFLLYDQWGCLDPNDEFANTVSPPFVAILDLSAVKAKATNPKELKCKETQFADRKMVSKMLV